jgi:hydrogenase maturation factor
MNLVYGKIVEFVGDDEIKMARVRIGRAITEVSIGLLTGVRTGDRVLLCDGVAIAKVEESKADHVSRHPGQTD